MTPFRLIRAQWQLPAHSVLHPKKSSLLAARQRFSPDGSEHASRSLSDLREGSVLSPIGAWDCATTAVLK
jgi:hypothetical protein